MQQDSGFQTADCPPPKKWVLINDRFVLEADAKVPVFDRSFRYGDGLFETLRVYGGRPFAWEQHAERLQRGSEFLRLRLPFSASELRHLALELIRRNQMPEAVLRLQVSRGSGRRGYAPAGDECPLLVMTLGGAPVLDEGAPVRWKLITSSLRLPENDVLSGFKTCNQLLHILAAAEARERSAQDALLLNANGCVVETTCANLFWIQDGVVCTPPLTSGALPGVTRAWVINAGAELGVEVCERNVSRADLLRANGVFLTQSVWEIIEVTRVDETVLPLAPFVGTLRQAYRKACLSTAG